MPKPISPEQLESLQSNGVVVPGLEPKTTLYTPVEAGLVLRTLGDVGLPHSEKISRLDDSAPTTGSSETLNQPGLEASYRTAHETVSLVMGLVGEPMPAINEPSLVTQLERLKPVFALFEARGLEPEVVLRPANQPLSYWQVLTKAVGESPLNPYEPNPNYNPSDPSTGGPTRKVLHNGGLYIDDGLKKEWDKLTKEDSSPDWELEVISSLEKPKIVSVTSYGYTDNKNEKPSDELNQILSELNQPLVADRSGKNGQKLKLTQPNIHPTLDGYIMHQLVRIIQGRPPLDSNTCSWLKGTLSSGSAPVGVWVPGNGRVSLGWSNASNLGDRIGARPSGRG